MGMEIKCPHGLHLELLTEPWVDKAKELCDRYVGINLYPEAVLSAAVTDPDHYFYFVVTPEGERLGYLYIYMTDLAHAAASCKIGTELVTERCPVREPRVGVIRSIGLSEELRQLDMSDWLMDFAVRQIRAMGGALILSAGWIADGKIPIQRTFEGLGFTILTISHLVWYDNPEVYCPVCGGRCTCDAAVFYKPLFEEDPV